MFAQLQGIKEKIRGAVLFTGLPSLQRNASVKLKLQAVMLAVSLASVGAIGSLAWHRAQVSMKEEIFGQLTSIRSSKANQIEVYFEILRNHVETLAEDRMVVEAMVELNKGFREIDTNFIPREWEEPLQRYYEDEFFPRLSQNISGELAYGVYRPTGQAARYLQHYYISTNPHEVGEKDRLLDAGDGSDYSRFHAKYHTLFHNIIQKFGYYDLFLIDYKTGNIVYSVYKETDYATNLDDGPYRESGLAQAVRAVRQNPEYRAIQLIDFQFYRPSYGAPAAFFSAPIYNGPHIVGILAVQLPVDRINNQMTGFKQWQQNGLGESGETYRVGSDLLMRSISRFLVEDRDRYKAALKKIGTPDSTIERIEQLDTTILLQEVDTEAARLALGGASGTKIVDDYRGLPVLSSYAPLDLEIDGLDWAILAEIDLAEAYEPVHTLQIYLVISTAIVVVAVSFIALGSSYSILQPVNALLEGVRRVSVGEKDVRVEIDSNDEFGQLASAFNEMVENLRTQTELLDRKSQENDELLLNILPSSVANQLKKGQKKVADRVEQATVLYSRVLGLQELTAERGVEQAAKIFNDLVGILDKEAEKCGVEKLKTLGERYVAICGLTRPHPDRVRRTVDFALNALDHLQGFNHRHATQFNLCMGIHMGEVVGSVIGTDKNMYYNLWGETVALANYLSGQAEPGKLLMVRELSDPLEDMYSVIACRQVEFGGYMLKVCTVGRTIASSDLVGETS